MHSTRGWWPLVIFLCCFHHAFAQQGIAFYPNPHASWYFLTPTGYGPPPGKTVYRNGMLAAWQYEKTTANGHTAALGLIPTLLAGESFMPIWVSGQARFPIGGTKRQPAAVANIGGFFLTLPNSDEATNNSDFSFFYGNFTFGSREKNFAIGAGIAPTGFGDGIHPSAITLHGLTRLGRRSCLVTENYMIHDRGTWIPCSMTGWRGWRGRTAFDLAVMLVRIPAGSSASQKRLWLPLPWLALHRNLNFDIFRRGDD